MKESKLGLISGAVLLLEIRFTPGGGGIWFTVSEVIPYNVELADNDVLATQHKGSRSLHTHFFHDINH